MEIEKNGFSFLLKQIGIHFGDALVEVDNRYIKKLYTEASLAQQAHTSTQGFFNGGTPISYIEKNFQPHLLEHIKEFVYRYFVLNQLAKEVTQRKILLAGQPRITDIYVQLEEHAKYSFSLPLMQSIPLQGWKRLPFKAPKRKNYKDLDKQVENFLKDEAIAQKKAIAQQISMGDWVQFTVALLDRSGNYLFDNYKEILWVKVGVEEIDLPLQNLFVGRKKGDVIKTDSSFLQEYFSSHVDTHYLFEVVILDFVQQAYFDVEQFKKHFRLRNNKELHQKLIEVFSFRNDISQRRAMAEDTLKLLLTRHQFEVPNHLVLRRQKELLDLIQDNPDYQVYKMQEDFMEKIKILATKQIKEDIFMLQLALHEELEVTDEDIKLYLNLTKRQRTREFIHFQLPSTKSQGQEFPFSQAVMVHHCLREKALNYAIYYLTKQRIATV